MSNLTVEQVPMDLTLAERTTLNVVRVITRDRRAARAMDLAPFERPTRLQVAAQQRTLDRLAGLGLLREVPTGYVAV